MVTHLTNQITQTLESVSSYYYHIDQLRIKIGSRYKLRKQLSGIINNTEVKQTIKIDINRFITHNWRKMI